MGNNVTKTSTIYADLLNKKLNENIDPLKSFGLKVNSIWYDELKNALGVRRINSLYIPTKIIYNDPATIVFWEDGTKTVVKKAEGEVFNKYHAFTAALAKKILGNNSVVNRIVHCGVDQKEKEG